MTCNKSPSKQFNNQSDAPPSSFLQGERGSFGVYLGHFSFLNIILQRKGEGGEKKGGGVVGGGRVGRDGLG